MEPPIVSYRRVVGPVAVWIKRAIRKCIRWYVRPQTEALEAEAARLRDELTRLEKQLVRMQATALRQYLELSGRLEQAPDAKAA